MNQVIIEAINNKKQLQVTYNDAVRVVEPHAYGYDKNDKLKVRVFQTDAEHEGWRLFNEDAILELAVLDTSFEGPREGYQRGDRHIVAILAEL